MADEEKPLDKEVGEMHKRREPMPDGRRYIIYYTFGDAPADGDGDKSQSGEVSENV